MPDYFTSYNFCWPNQQLWNELVQAQQARDGQAIAMVVEAQYNEIGSDVRQFDGIATDPDIMMVNTSDAILLDLYEAEDEYDEEEELELVEELAKLRDRPLTSLPRSLPESVRKLSWFLRDETVQKYAPGKDFGGKKEHERVYAGLNPTGRLTIDGETPIRTGRDIASLVHMDHPVTYSIKLISQLFAEKVSHRFCAGMRDTPGLTRFASVGGPFITGAPGEILRRVGLISFRTKWELLHRRPAQVLADDYGRYLPWAFPEAHPSHPSRNAMHYICYAALGGYIKYMFNKNHVLPSGETVEYEVDLWVGNFGDGRLWPGVHSRQDHDPFKRRAEALGVRIAREHLNEVPTGSIPIEEPRGSFIRSDT